MMMSEGSAQVGPTLPQPGSPVKEGERAIKHGKVGLRCSVCLSLCVCVALFFVLLLLLFPRSFSVALIVTDDPSTRRQQARLCYACVLIHSLAAYKQNQPI